LQFQAEQGYDVEYRYDDRSPSRPYGKAVSREVWRFQIQGPNAWQIIEKVNGGPVDQVKFFKMGYMNVAGAQIRTLRHGMAGAPGLEIWGPYDSYERSRDAILEAGKEFGLDAGSRAYCRTPRAAGSIAAAGDLHRRRPRGGRQWLPAGMQTNARGRPCDDIEDYYLTPWDSGTVAS
jgi:vanillate/3-O-methylgallate O-demethylase